LEDRLLLSIFGTDDRHAVGDATAFPYRAIGRVTATFPDGKSFWGTGALIDPSHVLTAGHVIYGGDHGGWATAVTFTPGQNGTSKPYGSASGTLLRSYTGWTQNGDYNFDLGLITLNQSLGNTVGWFGVEAQPDSFYSGHGSLNSAGYPKDKSFNGVSMYSIFGAVDGASAHRVGFRGSLDIAGGQSGSPMWRYDPASGNRAIDAIVSTESPTTNAAVRITGTDLTNLKSWLAEDSARQTPTTPSRGIAPTSAEPTVFQDTSLPQATPDTPAPVLTDPAPVGPSDPVVPSTPPPTSPPITLPPVTLPPVTLPPIDLPTYVPSTFTTSDLFDPSAGSDVAPTPTRHHRHRRHRTRRHARGPAHKAQQPAADPGAHAAPLAGGLAPAAANALAG
jgi:V8-like Glu-specific endopeptidase